MHYKEYSWIDKTFILVAVDGIGVTESPQEEKGPVFASNSYDEILEKASELFPRDSSGWTYHNYNIHANLSTEQGKKLYELFTNKFKALEKYVKEHPKQHTTHILSDEQTITLQKNPALDGKSI